MAQMRLQDQVAVITGAGSGFGRAASVMFAAHGACVYAVDLDDDAVEATVAEIGGSAIAHRADVSSSSDMESLAQGARGAGSCRRGLRQRWDRRCGQRQ